MKPEDLEALLRTLQQYGVTSYQTPDLSLSLVAMAPVVKRLPGPGEDAGSMEDAELPELGPEDGDPESFLEDLTAKIHEKNHPAPPGRVKRAG